MTSNTQSRQPDLTDLLRQTLDQLVPAADRIRARILAAIGSSPSASVGEILTLPEAAAILRLSEVELAEVAESLPAFELAGKVLVRKSRLLEWIEQRERQYTWSAARSADASRRHLSVMKGVA